MSGIPRFSERYSTYDDWSSVQLRRYGSRKRPPYFYYVRDVHYSHPDWTLNRIRRHERKWWRASAGINMIPIHKKYFSAVLQRWFSSKKEAEDAEDAMREDLLSRIEEEIGYKRKEWTWFTPVYGFGVQEVSEWHEEFYEFGEKVVKK